MEPFISRSQSMSSVLIRMLDLILLLDGNLRAFSSKRIPYLNIVTRMAWIYPILGYQVVDFHAASGADKVAEC